MKRINIVFTISFVLVCLVLTATQSQAALTGMVSGKVIDAEMDGIKHAKVTLKSVDGSNADRTIEASKKGSFRFTNVQPGNYYILAAAEGYVLKNRQVIRVSSNGKVRINVFLADKSDESPEIADESNQKVLDDKENSDNTRPVINSAPSNTGSGTVRNNPSGIQAP